MSPDREDRSAFAQWWFSVDRTLLAGVLALIFAGVIISFAAGPTVAIKKDLPVYHFVSRHLVFAAVGALLVVGLSFVRPAMVRRLSLVLFLGALVAMVMVLVFGDEVNGARRWLRFQGLSLQPSELAKPAFVVLSAWLLAERTRRHDMPAGPIAILLWLLFAGLLVLQPNLGQALLVTIVWGGMLFVAGVRLVWLATLGALAAAGVAAGYAVFAHVRRRVDAFLDPDGADTYQIDRARQSFIEGGWFGRGPGEGTVKSTLPDAHTDFILAVIAEEYGIIACFVLIGLFLFVAVRALGHVWAETDAFRRTAVAGLVMLLTFQAAINMGVNVGLLPAKGMTLPFLSYGGSSLVGLSIAMGLLASLTRRRADAPAGLKLRGAGPGLAGRAV